MSAGRSSQLAACFSVERTKYLMLSKSIVVRSAPQAGSGLRPNRRRPLSRRSSIHCGSFFLAEMSRTTASLRPRWADAPAMSGSAHPYSYRPRPASGSTATVSLVIGVICSVMSPRGCVQGATGDVRGADPVAVGDRGQTLDVRTDQARDHLRLGLAQLGELDGHVGHRAVVLAELAAGGDRGRAGSVPLRCERPGQRLGPGDRIGAR